MRARRTMASSSLPPSKRASNMPPPPPPPPWEVVLLVAQLLDPKTLATASCVSKSWSSAMSSDHLWKPICLSHHPSSLHLITTDPSLSARRLFALLRASSQRLRRNPSIPRISLRHLIFAIDIFQRYVPVLALAKPGEDLPRSDHGGVFRFEAAVDDGDANLEVGEVVKIGWTVVMKGWRGAFTMMDRTRKGRPVGGTGLWFSEELPRPGCCSASMGGGLEAELGLEFSDDGAGNEEGRRRVGSMSLGLMSIADWRYVGVDDGLLYLQHFLLPNNI